MLASFVHVSVLKMIFIFSLYYGQIL